MLIQIHIITAVKVFTLPIGFSGFRSSNYGRESRDSEGSQRKRLINLLKNRCEMRKQVTILRGDGNENHTLSALRHYLLSWEGWSFGCLGYSSRLYLICFDVDGAISVTLYKHIQRDSKLSRFLNILLEFL